MACALASWLEVKFRSTILHKRQTLFRVYARWAAITQGPVEETWELAAGSSVGGFKEVAEHWRDAGRLTDCDDEGVVR
jgi:hypothetical protein